MSTFDPNPVSLSRRRALAGLLCGGAALALPAALALRSGPAAAMAQPQFDVRDFGARPTARFDNGPAIEAACRAAAAVGGGVLIPQGRFEVSEVRLPAGLGSIGGPGWLVGTSPSGEAVVTAGLDGSSLSGASISLNIDCNRRARRGFFAVRLTNSVIDGCRVENLAANGGDAIRLNFPGCRGNRITNNEIALPGGKAFPAGLFGIQVVGETASPTGGIEQRGRPIRPAVTVRDTYVGGNRVTGGSHGIAFFGAEAFVCEGNTLTGQSARNIIASPTCSDGRIAANTCIDSGSSAIHLALGCRRIAIVGNTIRSNRASASEDDDGAIQAYADCEAIQIVGNEISGDWRYGIYVAVAGDVLIADNRIDASAFTGPAIAIESGWREALPAAARYSRARRVGYEIARGTGGIRIRDNHIANARVAFALAQVGRHPLRSVAITGERVVGTPETYLYAFEESAGMLAEIEMPAPALRTGAVVLPRGAAHLVGRIAATGG